MKKTLLAVAIGALAVASTASANWYVQGDLGVAKTKFTSYSELNKTRVEPRVSIGYRLGDFRVAADYTHYGKFTATNEEAKIQGFGFSAIYDIDLNSAVKPYVGARLATNIIKHTQSDEGIFLDSTDTKFGYGAVAGASYRVTPNVALDGGVEYNRLGTYDDTKINNYGVKAGVRYEF